MMMAAPMPVPRATSITSRYPRAAPTLASAQADGLDPVMSEEFGHRVGDGLLGPRRAGRRGRSLQLGDDPAVFVDHPRRDFGATDINADG